METTYPWYSVVGGTDDLEQGDFLPNCPIFFPDYSNLLKLDDTSSEDEVGIAGEVKYLNVVVMTQSCDLANKKVKTILVSPYWTLEELTEENAEFGRSKTKEDIRRGNRPGFHMLNACDIPDWERPIRIVEFAFTHSMPREALEQLSVSQGQRLRLNPPYREHLSQAFARYFMRVGLPADIPHF